MYALLKSHIVYLRNTGTKGILDDHKHKRYAKPEVNNTKIYL